MTHRKPSVIKQIEGTYRKDRAVKNEVQPTIALSTDYPTDLNEWGGKLWLDIMDEYQKLGLITKVDVASLMAVCMEWGRYCEASDILAAQGLQIEEEIYNNKGDIVGTKTVTNPLIRVVSDAFKNYKSMCVEFGMTPASRTKIAAPDQKNNDGFEDFG